MADSNFAKMMAELAGMDDEDKPKETYKRAPFAWPGGKYRSLPHLLPHLPVRRSYIEVCGGSGVVLLNRPRSPLEVFNDRYSGVTAFYLCLQNRNTQLELAERLKYFIHSREMFAWACDTWENADNLVERAARWFYIIKTSFGSIGDHWGRATESVGMIGPKLREAVGEFPNVHYRIRDVQIENLDSIECAKQYDNENAVTYFDPDYLGTARHHYDHNMDVEYHTRIIKTAHEGKGFFAISGYANPETTKLYDHPAWRWTEKYTWESLISAHPGEEGREKATEVLWIKDNA